MRIGCRDQPWWASALFYYSAVIFLFCFSGSAQVDASRSITDGAELTNVAQVVSAASLTPDSLRAIRLNTTVWYADSSNRRLVLSDSSGAAQFEADWIGPLPEPGQHIRVSGTGSVETVGAVFRLGRRSPLIDNNNMRAVSEKGSSIYLGVGRHPISLGYFHVNGKAELGLAYSGPGIDRQTIPESVLFQSSGKKGLNCDYYEGVWQTLPNFDKLTPIKTGVVSNFNFALARNKDEVGLGFGLKFDGEIEIKSAGTYTFYLRSRDGSQLFVERPSIQIEILGTNDFPTPQRVTIGQPAQDLNRFWAEAEGDITFVAERPEGGWDAVMNEGEATLRVQLAKDVASPSEIMDRHVILRGYCETARDPYDRIVPAILFVPGRTQLVKISRLVEDNADNRGGTNILLQLPSTIYAVRRLPTEVLQRGLPFRVRGVVTCVQRDHDAFVVQDSTAGIYIINSPETGSDLPEIGERVEIDGITRPGVGVARKISRLGLATLPEPIRPNWDQLLNGSMDAKYVEIRGVVDTFFHRANGWSHIDLQTRPGIIRIDVRRAGIRPGTLESYQGRVIRVRGCLFHAADLATQRLKVGQIRMSDMEVFPEEPLDADLFSLPRKTVTSLGRYDTEADALRRVKISGQIVLVQGRDYFLTDGEEGARFTLKTSPALKPGDLVDVVGFPELGGAYLIMRGVVVRKTGQAPVPEPSTITPEQLIQGARDSTLVRVEALLVNIRNARTNVTLELQAGSQRFLARLNSSEESHLDLQTGSRLELTGVYCARGNYSPLGEDLFPADLVLRSAADVRILEIPSRWTLKRLALVITILGTLTAVMLLWVHQLRRKVEERTREVRILNSNLEDRANALESANKELESFSYSVSHDLRAPLRSIDGFSRALLEDYHDKLDTEGKENLQTIRNASQRMGHLIDDMLMLAKVSRSEIRPVPVNLSALARTVTSDLQMVDSQRAVEFVIAEGLTVHADPQLMRVVLENLLGNAWKFTARQSTARIELGVTEHKGTPAYFVRDNGVGFDMEYVHKLFGAFQRLHTTEEFPGTGIGLATVQRIIHRQGGEVWAESILNKGATFYFTLANPENLHER